MYSNLFDMLYSFDPETIEQAVDLGETLGYWEQYKDKNITDDGMHIWHLHMPLKVWKDLLSSRINRRKSIYFPGRNKAHVWGKGLAQDDTIHESKTIKVTRRQLKRLIEGVLNEMPMLQPELLPPGFYVTVEETTYTPDGADWFVHSDGGPPESEPMKMLKIRMLDEKGRSKAELDMRYWKPEYCGGTWEVNRAYLRDGAPDGTGPMMYDIAMELAGDSGIMSDRMTTSDDAANVWAFYLDNRADVVTKPLVNCTGKEYRGFGDGRRLEFTEKKFIKAPSAPRTIDSLGDKFKKV